MVREAQEEGQAAKGEEVSASDKCSWCPAAASDRRFHYKIGRLRLRLCPTCAALIREGLVSVQHIVRSLGQQKVM